MAEKTSFTIEPGKPTIIIRRLFNAPRRLVWEAWTKPEHVAHWYGFRTSSLSECRIDLRPGGAWRFVIRMPDGSEHGFGGTYREISPPERLVSTFRYDGYPDAEALETVTFEEQGRKTIVTSIVLHKSVENRDGHVASGMEAGAVECYERLDEVLESLSGADSPATRAFPKR
jgi:uncharacterized protein YndB with AHSA1/START domain